jgi:alpha-beta hydrolase superfamily lysophospholipase
MRRFVKRIVTWGFVAVTGVVLVVSAVRIFDSQRGPSLERWHTYIPQEMRSSEIGRSDWAAYLGAEKRLFDDLQAEVTKKLDEGERVPSSRYFEGSPVHPSRFSVDWNRSFELQPEGEPVGAVVLLHGLTDSPYSLRHVAKHYRDNGFVALGIRLPAHGTVPGALTDIGWEDWLAATHLAMREARRRVGQSRPVHLVGYSNGGALAVMQALEALESPSLPRADRVVLVSPMIGVTEFARFAGLAALPAVFPAFAKAAWLSILPEFNPFKYNSFPVNAARESFKLTQALQARVRSHSRNGRLENMPPILTFQSALDHTVHTSAIISALYDRLPANGSELVLFDVNRAAKLGPLLRPTSEAFLARVIPQAPRSYRVTIVTNTSVDRLDVAARVVEAGSATETIQALDLVYPSQMYSLSHIAVPFPPNDGLYGSQPDASDDFGVRLGVVAARGEMGALIMSMDTLMRASDNPFFPFVKGKLSQVIRATGTPARAP